MSHPVGGVAAPGGQWRGSGLPRAGPPPGRARPRPANAPARVRALLADHPQHGKRTTQGGRNEVRRVLYMAALTARHHNPVIRAFAQRLKAAGKPFKVVMTACMRKLLVIAAARSRAC